MTTDWLKETNWSLSRTVAFYWAVTVWQNAFLKQWSWLMRHLGSYCVLYAGWSRYKNSECLKPLFAPSFRFFNFWSKQQDQKIENGDSMLAGLWSYINTTTWKIYKGQITFVEKVVSRITIIVTVCPSRRPLLCCSGQRFKKGEQKVKTKCED